MVTFKQSITSMANKIVTKENIISYLDVVAANENLSYQNQMLVFLQNPKAKKVCGRGAWEFQHRKVKKESKPITLLFPKIRLEQEPEEFRDEQGNPLVEKESDTTVFLREAKYDSFYIPVNAYDYNSTSGDEIKVPDRNINFADRIAYITDATFESLPQENFASPMENGKYNPKQNVFYVSNQCFDFERNRVLLALYVDYLMMNRNCNDKVLRIAILYVVFKHFGCKTDFIHPALFSRIHQLLLEEKVLFLRRIQWYSRQVILDMEGYSLSFNETAYVNDLLLTDEHADMWILFDRVIASLEENDKNEAHNDLKNELMELRHKLMLTSETFLYDLCAAKLAKHVYTFPSYKLLLDPKDYLREERPTIKSQ